MVTTKYYFEVQLPYAPGCGWLRSPYGRDSFEVAWKEGTQYVENALRRGESIALKIHVETK